MPTTDLTLDTFDAAIESNEIVLVDFWASWCGPCRAFAPVYETASEQHTDILFAKVDTEDQQELATRFEIRSIPTLMVLRDQVLLYAQPGALPPQALQDLLEQVKGLDMDEVRRKIAAKAG